MGRCGIIIWFIGAFFLLTGCDPLTRYKITSTIFDGVPKMPSAEQYCKEYHENKLGEELASAKKKQEQESLGQNASSHPPYEEKNCDNCHNKNTDSGFVRPVKELCFVCHKDFIKGAFAHGPAAVGSCLECHLPHNSAYPSLLKQPAQKLCQKCHREERQAKQIHIQSNAKGLGCVACHDPHSGDARFFLK